MKYTILSLVTLSILTLVGCTSSMNYPEVSPEGLTKVPSKRADAVYVLPEADLSGYTKVALLEPQISFRKDWQSDINVGRSINRISAKDMESMIATGKRLLSEEFIKELKKGGYEVVTETGADVLVVKPAIIDLDVFAPDPQNTSGIWRTVYTDGSGRATLWLELYDSVTSQLLVQAYDTRTNEGEAFTWRMPTNQSSNINDARYAFQSWAKMLVKGLETAKAKGN